MARKINKIIVHCTDSDDSLDIGFKEIDSWHRERGWYSKKSNMSCGYHYIVRKRGRVEAGRLESDVGAHCYGQNKSSLGVVWVGRKDMTTEQKQALLKLLRKLIDEHGLKPFDVYGHCEFTDGKTCPNLDMHRLRVDLLFTKG